MDICRRYFRKESNRRQREEVIVAEEEEELYSSVLFVNCIVTTLNGRQKEASINRLHLTMFKDFSKWLNSFGEICELEETHLSVSSGWII